ncbi:MAG TPA: type II toxin-antitoxin system VapC family toxin [Thermoanaerobaculia bacterium]
MNFTYTVDASVFLNGFNAHEPRHEESRRFLGWLREEAVPIIVPALLLPEVAAALARGSGDAGLARRFAQTLSRLPHLVLIPLDEVVASLAADAAAELRLRGSDAVYIAVAQRFGTTLVTLDGEQLERGGLAVTTRVPMEALREVRGL